MNKYEIDEQAEREGIALSRQGRAKPMFVEQRLRRQADYNEAEFDKLFRVEQMPFEERK